MAKISYSSLKWKEKEDTKTIKIEDTEIEVKQYLPVNEKMRIISKALSLAQRDEEYYINIARIEVFLTLEIIYAYTNITFTDKQKEQPQKIFDVLVSNGYYAQIYAAIPPTEVKTLNVWCNEIAHSIYEYKNSAMGIMDALSTDYKDAKFDAETIRKQLADPENVGFLKEVMEKMG